MTFQECHQLITSLRLKQGTRHPIVRVDYAGTIYQGRVARSYAGSGETGKPYSVLELEDPSLSRQATLLQIANISPDGIGEPLRN